MTFAPAGNSINVEIGPKSATFALPTVPSAPAGIRILPTKMSQNTYMYIKLGDASVTVSPTDGMPLLSAIENIVGIPNSETHIAILFASGNTANIQITSGKLLA